jgi:hypothetical protein
MNPSTWSDEVWSAILAILAAYLRKWSGPDSPVQLSPEERDEIRSRIVMDMMTTEVPDGILSPVHWAFRTARRWRMRGWAGDTETDRERKRVARAAARAAMADPGSAESHEERGKSPFRGMSDDARQPTPLAILIAAETAERGELRYVSDRQRKARRRPVKGNTPPPRYRVVPVGTVGRPRVGFGAGGRPLYFPGAATRIAYVPIPPDHEVGPYDRRTRSYGPHVPHVGRIGHREVGKVKADPIPPDLAHAAVRGRAEARVRVRNPMPAPIPATPGDGTEWRACDTEWFPAGPGYWRRLNG